MANPQTPTTGEQPRRATVADHLVDRLVSWGVHRSFGYPLRRGLPTTAAATLLPHRR